jgi:transposase
LIRRAACRARRHFFEKNWLPSETLLPLRAYIGHEQGRLCFDRRQRAARQSGAAESIHSGRTSAARSAGCRALIARIRQEAAEQLAALQARLEAEHKAAILALLRRYYGPRSETFDPRQLLLFGQQIDTLPLEEASVAEEAGEQLVTRQAKQRHPHGRQQLPAALERIEIEHDLDDKACPACGHERHRIGAQTSEQLEYFPASFKVLKHIRHKYACAHCEQEGYEPQIEAAKKPAQPIEKGLPGPSLLAYVVTSKLGDHLPLYRLENIFARQGVEVARSTMCAWMRAAGELVAPLVVLMAGRIRQSKVIGTDDTTVPIQSPGAASQKNGQCRKGRIWCYLGDAAHPYIVYDYTPRRTRDGPAQWLDGYAGYLQADAYGGYDGIFHSRKVTEVACWAHARRKFYDAQDSDEQRSAQMLALIGQLYQIERESKELSDTLRLAARQERSVPIYAVNPIAASFFLNCFASSICVLLAV